MSRLLTIPREFRNEFYTCALVTPSGSVTDYTSANDQHSETDFITSHDLLLTCRQIYTYEIYFGKNTFFFSRYSDPNSLLKDLGSEERLVITSLALILGQFFEGTDPFTRDPVGVLSASEMSGLHSTSCYLCGCQKLRSISFVGHAPSTWVTNGRLAMLFALLSGMEEVNVADELEIDAVLGRHARIFYANHVDLDHEINRRCNCLELKVVRELML